MTNSASKFVALEEIARTTNLTSLRIKLRAADRRVRDAETIGWTALAESWRIKLEAVKARLDELGAAHALTRRRVALASRRPASAYPQSAQQVV